MVKGFKPSLMRCTSKYFIFGEFRNVIQFTRDGQVVRNIGRRGQGPGEYNYIVQVDVDEKAGKVYVLSTGRRFNVYDLETGKYLQSAKQAQEKDKEPIKQELSELLVKYYDGSFARLVQEYIRISSMSEEEREALVEAMKQTIKQNQ